LSLPTKVWSAAPESAWAVAQDAREQIKWTPIQYFDNKVVCSLIEDKRPPGVFAEVRVLWQEVEPTNEGLISRAWIGVSSCAGIVQSGENFEGRQGQFIIKHYAGDVGYAVEGMTDKNKDQLSLEVRVLWQEVEPTNEGLISRAWIGVSSCAGIVQDEYAREQIKWTPIQYFDNKVVCSLIEDKRPPGVNWMKICCSFSLT
jgi:myosin heavy subunit